MTKPERAPKVDHPLLADLPRLGKITDNMQAQISRVLYAGRATAGAERLLVGGDSAKDVLQEALLALLRYDPAKLTTTWEALSVGIAKNKALTALRDATKGRRSATTAPGAADDVAVLSLDDVSVDVRDESVAHNPELEFEHTQQQLVLVRLARELLSDRDRTVFFGIHYEGRTKAAIAAELGLTPPGVGYIYINAAKRLYTAACADPAFPTVAGTPEGRTP